MKNKRKREIVLALAGAMFAFSALFPFILTEGESGEPIQTAPAADEPLPAAVEIVEPAAEPFEVQTVEYTGKQALPSYIDMSILRLNGDFTLPLDSAYISSKFGFRVNPVSGVYRFHSGLDLAAPHGSNIYAMMSGTVSTAGYDSGYGKYIIVTHDSGLQSLYAHCSELYCEKGEYVSEGEIIALVGSTGNSTGPHLHVEFRLNGKRYNPIYILGEYYS